MAHIRKLPSGKWRAIAKVNGLQRTGSAPTKAGAKALGARLELELGKMPTGGTATLGEMLHLHLAEQGYAATTLYDLGLIVTALPDDVMGWRVADVEPFTIEQLYRRLRKEDWTPHRVRKLHMLLSSAWTHRAAEYGWSSATLMRGVKAPKVDTPEVHPPSNVDVRRILATVERGVALFLRLAAVTGARRGELCGLQWGDVDCDRCEIVLRRSAVFVPGIGLQITEGKTGRAGQRVIGIDPSTIGLLSVWHSEAFTAAVELDIPAPIWVFSHNRGVTPWRGDYITREFARACQRAEVTDTHLHSMRHYMASQWLKGGEAAIDVAARLGHSNPATTYRTYAHYLGASDHAQANRHAAHLNPDHTE